MMDTLINTVERFLTPIIFIFYVLFGLLEVAYAPEFVMIIVCNILAVIIYCYMTGWDIVFFGGSGICVSQFVSY